MRYIYSMTILFFLSNILFAQSAISYFPTDEGTTWKYEVFNLDSNNVVVDTSRRVRTDSLVGQQNYYGRDAYLTLFGESVEGGNPKVDLEDSLFYSFDGPDASVFFSFFSLEPGDSEIDSLIAAFLATITNWYDIYRFASPVDQTYNLLQKDTTITLTFEYQGLPITVPTDFYLRVDGKRKADQDISTVFGTLSTKVFEFTISLNADVQILPPLVVIPLELVNIPITYWIAMDYWIVKDYRSSYTVESLTDFGIDPITIPGAQSDIIEFNIGITGIDDNIAVNRFQLMQNFPNPFNPVTTITFTIPENVKVELNVYDIMGNHIAKLVNRNYAAGVYSVQFDGSNLPSGTYFYHLTAGNRSYTKKMILIK
jgi:hypothetical protein